MITDTSVKKELNIPNSTFYEWKKRDPRAVELVKKGLVAEKVLNKNIFDEMIKNENKKRNS